MSNVLGSAGRFKAETSYLNLDDWNEHCPSSSDTASTNAPSLPAAFIAFPSPASISDALESPTLNRSLAQDNINSTFSDSTHDSRPKALWTPQSAMIDPHTTHADPSVPRPVALNADSASCLDHIGSDATQTDMNIIVGGALAPISEPSTIRQLRKHDPGLRLPSFESLGIAASPLGTDLSIANDGHNSVADLLRSTCPGGQSIEGDVVACPSNPAGRAVPTSVQHYITTLTPPAEKGEVDFAHRPNLASTLAGDRSVGHATRPSLSENAQPSATHVEVPQSIPTTPAMSEVTGSWIESVLHTIVPTILAKSPTREPIKVLSQALPCTSATGHMYPTVIAAVRDLVANTVELHHAISGNFNLADLPTSPPTTPRSAARLDDYFGQVFATGVHISDYQNKDEMTPRSPRPVVSPSSVHISIVERYIPPSSPREFAHIFRPSGPSMLVDRLVELSPSQGSLVFVYPTRAGATTFVKKYLGPIIEPQLRTLVVANGLSTHIGRALGEMAAVEKMLSFEELQIGLETLCRDMEAPAFAMSYFQGATTRFEVIHASRQLVPLSRDVWAQDWWTKQEKPRVRELLTRYAREAEKHSSNAHNDRPTSAAELIQRLLDGIISRPYNTDQVPMEGIEVGAFVIQRTR